MKTQRLFPTFIYSSLLSKDQKRLRRLSQGLFSDIEIVVSEDHAGHKWSEKLYQNGFTSYGSSDKLNQKLAHFTELEGLIDPHVKKFSQKLQWDLKGGKLVMSDCWINIMEVNTVHSGHIHPNSVLSGTFYLQATKGASPLKFEDPRLSLMMASPARKQNCLAELKPFIEFTPQTNHLVLFESWLRHEVPISKNVDQRLSISFNYAWVRS